MYTLVANPSLPFEVWRWGSAARGEGARWRISERKKEKGKRRARAYNDSLAHPSRVKFMIWWHCGEGGVRAVVVRRQSTWGNREEEKKPYVAKVLLEALVHFDDEVVLPVGDNAVR
jgi:hypothetical protein